MYRFFFTASRTIVLTLSNNVSGGVLEALAEQMIVVGTEQIHKGRRSLTTEFYIFSYIIFPIFHFSGSLEERQYGKLGQRHWPGS